VFAVRSDGRVAPAGGGLPPAVAALGGADGWRKAVPEPASNYNNNNNNNNNNTN
jgi:hypothetical protein